MVNAMPSALLSVAKMSLRCMVLALHSCIAALYADVSIVVGGGLVGKICSEGVALLEEAFS